MTATSDDPRPRRTAASSRASGPATEPVREVCPYLEAAEGGWRSVQPTRDHRCTATSPASPLAVSKQRELCLQPAHFGCATYQAARQVSADAKTPADGGLWPETRGAVLSLETARGARTALPGFAGRTSGQAALIALMVLAFVLLAITRVSPPLSADVPSPADAGAIVSPAPGASGSPVAPASPTVSPSPTPAATPTVPPSSAPSGDASPAAGSSGSPAAGSSGSPAPTSAASPTPASSPGAPSPSAGATTYRVQGGDTLSGIAARFGVTVRALKAANGITNVALIRPGQVLVIPH